MADAWHLRTRISWRLARGRGLASLRRVIRPRNVPRSTHTRVTLLSYYVLSRDLRTVATCSGVGIPTTVVLLRRRGSMQLHYATFFRSLSLSLLPLVLPAHGRILHLRQQRLRRTYMYM